MKKLFTLFAFVLGTIATTETFAQECTTICSPCNSKNQRTCCYVCWFSSCQTISCAAVTEDPKLSENEAWFSVAGMRIVANKKQGEKFLVQQIDKPFINYLENFAKENPELVNSKRYITMNIDETPKDGKSVASNK